MGDFNINNAKPLNPFMYPWQSPQTETNIQPDIKSQDNFKANLERAQQTQADTKPGAINVEKSDFSRPNTTGKRLSPTQEKKGWPKPYRPSMYKAKNLKQYKQIAAHTKKRAIPKSEANNPLYTVQKPDLIKQFQMYKQDQLLSNPGGDYYFERDGQMVYDPDYDFSDTKTRIGKDLSDSLANLKNAGKNIVGGAEYNYVDDEGKIQTAKKTGLLKTVGRFLENVFDALTFGSAEVKPPEGIVKQAGYFGKKLFVDGLLNNIMLGIPRSAINVGEDLLLATLNAIEIVPDTVIGNSEMGRKITTQIFDNGQVFVDYITDVLPSGEAWMRVHAAGSKDDGFRLPYLYNLKTPTQGISDLRWAHVRNTPLRKVIETVGSIIADMNIKVKPYLSLAPDTDEK